MIDKKDILFPHKIIRKVQEDMVLEVLDCLKEKKHLIVHAPTGLGKTAASLSPAVSFAMKKNLTVFFLTSRHTQHHIVVDTLKEINNMYGANVKVCDIIGKQWMCGLGEVRGLYGSEFSDYCKKLREDNKCELYSNTKKKSGAVTVEAKAVLSELKSMGPLHCERLIEVCINEKVCPYEMAALLAKEANVIIADYYYVFSPKIRDSFFSRANKEIGKSIIIVDEAHNLPKRCKELMTSVLSSFILERAVKEAVKFGFIEESDTLREIKLILEKLGGELDEKNEEKLTKVEKFVDEVNKIKDYDELISELTFVGDEIREKQRASFVGSVGAFLDAWQGPDKAFARIISKKTGMREPYITLMYKCLDPSLVTKEVIDAAHSIICMSGTLTPTSMYADILGFNDAKEKVFDSPFPTKNKLSLIVPETTTKFTRRGKEEFERIAKVVAEMVNLIPGNSLVFFPSYSLRDSIYGFFESKCSKTIFLEEPRMSKEEKNDFLERFKKYSKSGATLLGVATGSFGEGIDLPGDFVKGVIVVGLPLEKPSLEVKELIDYYDEKFHKGWEYGYIYPAMIKTMQNAGRCIRSETDRGVVIFLDERYINPMYYNCFPSDYGVKISKDWRERIKGFFNEKIG